MLSNQRCSLLPRAPYVPEATRNSWTFLLVFLTPVLKRSISTLCFLCWGLCCSHLQFWSQCSLKVLEARLLIPWQQVHFLTVWLVLAHGPLWLGPLTAGSGFLTAGAPSHAPWQQQNNILMPAIMANVFGKLMNKIPFSVSFYNSDVLFSCPVSPCIF